MVLRLVCSIPKEFPHAFEGLPNRKDDLLGWWEGFYIVLYLYHGNGD